MRWTPSWARWWKFGAFTGFRPFYFTIENGVPGSNLAFNNDKIVWDAIRSGQRKNGC